MMDHHISDNASEQADSQRQSRATSPGGTWREDNTSRKTEVNGQTVINGARDGEDMDTDEQATKHLPSRYRPRTFPYQRYLPYIHEDREMENLDQCIKRLYIAVSAGDFVPGATHWTREIRGWIQLKFDLPKDIRVKLAKLYYELALAPGMDVTAADRFAGMFMTLTKRKHYLRAGQDLILDWRPLYKELKTVLPSEVTSAVMVSGGHVKRTARVIIKMCSFAQLYFDPEEIPHMLDEILPYFSTSSLDGAFAVVGLLNLLLPTTPAPAQNNWQPQHFLPTMFHIWSLVSRSRSFDLHFLDILSRLSRDCLTSEYVPFTPFGIFTEDQASLIFTAILRLLDIPVSQVTSPYSTTVDIHAGMAALLVRDEKKHPVSHHIARLIVMSLSPACATKEDSILAKLEGLIQATETFFHPSNTGPWTRILSHLVFSLSDFFVMRWNRERSGEMSVPAERRLDDATKDRFVLCLRKVTFMGIFAKSSTAISFSLCSLNSLTYLKPTLILPGALQRIYPAMRGLVEVHRTTSAIRALHEITRIMTKTKGYRCHVTSLLGLALPGIDANDLDKTMHTLSYMQAVFYEVPMYDLTSPKNDNSENTDDLDVDGSLAINWVTKEVEFLAESHTDLEIDYGTALSDEEDARIVRSSTAEFHTFLSAFLDRVFVLLRNLPDAARLKTGSPEENVSNTLPATFTPLFSSISPDLYDLALTKIADFVSNHVVYQARDAMAFICSALCKVNPKKALGVLVPIMIRGIRTEVDDNGAGSTRTTGTEILPRDRAIVWYISLLSMSLVHVGSAVLDFEDELLELALYLRQRCKGIPSTHASNLIHHLLITLCMTYTMDHSLYEQAERSTITANHWGKTSDPQSLNIQWHYADRREISFAVKLFTTFAGAEAERLEQLINDSSSVKRDGTGKEWSDEVSRSLVLLRLILSGTSSLFDPRHYSSLDDKLATPDELITREELPDGMKDHSENTEDDFGATEDEDVKPTFQYPTGYQLSPNDAMYSDLHQCRRSIGQLLHRVHEFLAEKQPDDVTSFNALYTAYRSWFTDVGIERSAHVLDRVTRLLVADVSHFKVSGLRKSYPRPLLVRRANVYHLQRLRHNASPRHKTDLDVTMLEDLVQSSVSRYTEVRCTAQSAIESSLKVIIGVRPTVIPPLLKHLEVAIRDVDYARIKGAMYPLLFGSLTKSITRDWRFTPSLLKSYVNVMDIDKLSIQKLSSGAALVVMDMTRPISRMVILNKTSVDGIRPNDRDDLATQSLIARRKGLIQKRQDFVKERRIALSDELGEIARSSHWKKESRTATLVIGLSLRFEDIASPAMVELVVKRAVDTHPSLRMIYCSALIGLFAFIDMRAIANHNYENFLLDKKHIPGFLRKHRDQEDPDWTQTFLSGFTNADAEHYIDLDYPGWLVWGRTLPTFEAFQSSQLDYDEVETRVRSQIGGLLDKSWFSTYFGFLKQEPRDQSADRFKVTNTVALSSALSIVYAGVATATFDDIRDLVQEVFGDGSDKHQHRATAEILSAMINASVPLEPDRRSEIWSYVFPIVRNIMEDGITPENSPYWENFLDVILQNRDPRRNWPLVEWLASFRLDMSSNAAFKESSKIALLEHCILSVGWHFRLGKAVLADFMKHLDHPYKGVRGIMGLTIASIYRMRYHESYKDVETMIERQKSASSVGVKPYTENYDYAEAIQSVLPRIEAWRKERQVGQQSASSYTSGSKTVLAWLESVLTTFECTRLNPFSASLLEPLLHMMDIKEDPELQSHAYSVFRHLGNIPRRRGEEEEFCRQLIRIGKESTSWHQRLRVLINVQAIYFRHLFLMPELQQHDLIDFVSGALRDVQLEVRVGAGATLSGMIRCSDVRTRSTWIGRLKMEFEKSLQNHPLPRRTPGSTLTMQHTQIIIARHAAVLGLGALVQAFPYTSPPPEWVPDVLAILATKAAGDPGMVGKSAKTIVSDFKKTRQDTWHIDVKGFAVEQLEDLEGVLWKSYFA